jgi:hypothetical protein
MGASPDTGKKCKFLCFKTGARPAVGYPPQRKGPLDPQLLVTELPLSDDPNEAIKEIFFWVSWL